MESSLPLLTADLPGVPGEIKRTAADFVVEEIPLYSPCGSGDHTYFEIEKTDLTTRDAVAAVARSLGLGARAVGCAGQKDARGVTRQWLSVEHVDPARVAGLELERLRVLRTDRHGNKLKLGHLAGNRFEIRLRGCGAESLAAVREVLERIARRGLPNTFGEQRFGVRGDTWLIGRALLRGEADEALALIAGRPGPADTGRVLSARERFEAGDYEGSARTWPGNFREPRRLARAMVRSKGNARKALRALDKGMARFYVSAYQSRLFNELLAARLEEFDTVLEGDLAWLHANGAVFRVEDAAREAPRAAALEISASGPLFGRRMTEPTGRPAELEAELLARADERRETFDVRGPLAPHGGRRPLRVPVREVESDAGVDQGGPFVRLRFALPPGCYATSLLREVLASSRTDSR